MKNILFNQFLLCKIDLGGAFLGLKNAPKDAYEFCDFIRVLLFSNKL
jgi:hypothetical protein